MEEGFPKKGSQTNEMAKEKLMMKTEEEEESQIGLGETLLGHRRRREKFSGAVAQHTSPARSQDEKGQRDIIKPATAPSLSLSFCVCVYVYIYIRERGERL